MVARVAQTGRQAIYRTPKTRPPAAKRSAPPADDVEAAIVQVAKDNQTDGYRMVCALVARKLGRAVNRKRSAAGDARAPADPASPPAGSSSAARVLSRHAARAITPTTLTLGTDNGSAFTARAFKLALSRLQIAHRRGGYRDPESQAFIESWFSKLKERCVWLHEFETLDQAREVIAAYIRPLPPPPPLGA